jgi:hypothetical protein
MVMVCINGTRHLLITLALAISSVAWAAGNVDTVIGEVSVLNGVGQPRGISKGDRIVEGETVLTGAIGEVLITTDDSGVLAVRPLSRLLIEQYKVNGNDKDSVVLTLLRGGLRSVTGWISKTAPRNYRLTTPTATVGIRGTDHEAVIVDEGSDAGTWNQVTDGITVLATSAGQLEQIPGTPSATGRVQLGDQAPLAAPAPTGLFGPRVSDARANQLKEDAQANQVQRLQLRQQQVSSVGGLSSQGNPRISFQCAPNSPAQRALDSLLRAYERGDVGFIQQRIDPALIGFGTLLNDLMTSNNLQRQTRLQVLDRQMQCAPDVAVINFSWRKTFLSATTFTPVAQQGRSSVLITNLGAGVGGKWQLAGLSGSPLFKTATVAGSDGSISATPAIVSYGGPGSSGTFNRSVVIQVTDADLTSPTVPVQVTASNGDSETINLAQVSPGLYRSTQITIRRPTAIGSISVVPGNGAIDIPSFTSVTLTLTYNDAKAANGAAVQRRASLTLVP